MGALKAPGPDGIFPAFYQKFLGVVGPSVVQFVRNAFQNGYFDMKLNSSLISLILKEKVQVNIS